MKSYTQTETNIIINFSRTYVKTSADILNSDGFRYLTNSYLKELAKNDNLLLDKLNEQSDDLLNDLIDISKLLISFDVDKVKTLNENYNNILSDESLVLEFVESLYNYYRHFERYALIQNLSVERGIQNSNFIEETNRYTDLVLNTYRTIEGRFLDEELNVYRQLQAGINVGIVLNSRDHNLPDNLSKLKDISTIEKVILRPPFVCYTKANTRTGVYEEIGYDPIEKMEIEADHWLLYPAKIGNALVYIYFHRTKFNHGVSLANLFELAKKKDMDKDPDIVIIFGDTSGAYDIPGYHLDKEKIIGYVPCDDEYDYFGYMKKMILTCYNILQIKKGYLPIHGAMVNVTLKDKSKKNIVFLGDSGAGKSESIEAFRKIANKYLKDLKIIFDDMGTFKLENNELKAYGTETGAFVRLDDLENGYAFEQLDRAVFLNPNKVNARLVIPLTDYNTINKGHKVDCLLYANNYEDKESSIEFFTNMDEVNDVFINTKRIAKGTTLEKGLSESFFANPFGPVQLEAETRVLIDKYFNHMLTHSTQIGQVCTKLAIKGKESTGPQEAAIELLKLIMGDNK